MSRSVALSTLRARVRERGDFGPDTTSGRYTNTRLNREINAAWQRCREIATTRGDGTIYLKHTTPAAMTPGTLDSASSFGTVPMPSDAVAIHGIDVVFSSIDIQPLEAVSFADRNVFRNVYGGATGRPLGFCVINTGVESGSSVTAGSIAIMPAPDSGYTYTIWYVPKWTDLTSDTDVFDGVAGWEEWVICDTVMAITTGDNDAANTYAMCKDGRDAAEAMITSRVNAIQRVGPTRRRDVAGQSRRGRQLFWRRPR